MPDQAQERRRLTPLERAAQLRARAAEIEANATRQERKNDARRKIILGGTVLAEARENPEFSKQLADIIARRVTKPLDVKAIAEWQTASI